MSDPKQLKKLVDRENAAYLRDIKPVLLKEGSKPDDRCVCRLLNQHMLSMRAVAIAGSSRPMWDHEEGGNQRQSILKLSAELRALTITYVIKLLAVFRSPKQSKKEHNNLGLDIIRDILRDLHDQTLPFTAKQLLEVAQYWRRARSRYDSLLGSGWWLRHLLQLPSEVPLDFGESWVHALTEQKHLDLKDEPCVQLILHAASANTSKPSKRWRDDARYLLKKVGVARFRSAFIAASNAFPQPYRKHRANWMTYQKKPDMILSDVGMTTLRGLCWIIADAPTATIARALGRLCADGLTANKGYPPRAPRVANACLWALGEIDSPDALAQLAILKTRIRNKSVLKQVDKAYVNKASRMGLTVEDLQELGVPTFGFDNEGTLREEFDDVTLEMRIAGREIQSNWKRGSVSIKSVPAAVKRAHATRIKQLGSAAKEAQKMLGSQRDRLDSMMIWEKKWKLPQFTERYLNNPIVAAVATKLIWLIDSTPALFVGGIPTDVRGNPMSVQGQEQVSFWHPSVRSVMESLQWRQRLESIRLTQPFKQAHREVYLLTDAERATQVYSNRFAAHILRQTQFRALCSARGWVANLLGAWDGGGDGVAKKALPGMLLAELWFGAVVDEGHIVSPGWTHITTDQVRFHRGDRQNPVPLADVPPLVFSEVMRDVDLFVGVASVGNDPNWSDGGPEGRYRDYWHTYSFGDLSATASTRKEVLQRLIPRLKIASQCSISDKFLIVKGSKRTYKIHLGSGNILMEPNDQYLCIVPDARARARDGQEKLFLPFEGDNTLSIILSKAFLLAEDAKISDVTIVRQIER